MRFLRVTDDAALNVVPPGVYGAVELLALGATESRGAADNQGWMKAFHTMEKTFKQLGAVPHVATPREAWGLPQSASFRRRPVQSHLFRGNTPAPPAATPGHHSRPLPLPLSLFLFRGLTSLCRCVEPS